MSHTKLPWKFVIDSLPSKNDPEWPNSVVSADGTTIVRNGDYDEYGTCTADEARRIVACVNALDGVQCPEYLQGLLRLLERNRDALTGSVGASIRDRLDALAGKAGGDV